MAYGGAVVGALALTPLVIRFARMTGVVDLPNARKIHQTPIPRLGGLAIAIATFLAAVPLLIVARHTNNGFGVESWTHLITLFGTGAFVLTVGLLDDLIGVPSACKLVALILASFVLCASGAQIHAIHVRQFYYTLGWASWPLTVFWIVGVTVSINFIDGLDGLAAGIAGMAAMVLAIGSAATDQISIAIIAFALAGSLTGFLFFNFNPAKVFMGDCGSMFIGFMIAAAGVIPSGNAGTSPSILLPGMALIIPAFDTFFTLIRRRVLQRRSIFSAERGHIHHRLLDMGLRHKHAVLLIYGVTLVSSIAGLMLRFASLWLAIAPP